MNSLEKTNTDYQTQLNDWIKQEKAAIDLINAVGKLWFEKSIELILFRNQLVDRSASEKADFCLRNSCYCQRNS